MTAMLTDTWWPELSELLEKHRGVCHELNLIEREYSALESRGYADLAVQRRLQIRKRNAVDQFARIMQKVEPFRKSWPRIGPQLAAEHRSALSMAIDKATRTVSNTLHREQRVASG